MEPEDTLDEAASLHKVDSDDDQEDVLPLSLSQKRQVQKNFFRQWLQGDAMKELDRQARDAKGQNEEVLSIHQMLSQQRSAIIADPRSYQLELFERAKQQNTIAVLDTGSGKTLIAVLLLRHILDQELEDRRTGKAQRVAFFLVPSVNLVFQQHSVLECNLSHSIARLYGAMHTDLWTMEEWRRVLHDHMVIVCTAEILHQCLAHSFIHMRQINLLVLDEAHHAKQNNPYSR